MSLPFSLPVLLVNFFILAFLPFHDLLYRLTPSSDLDKRNTYVIHARLLRLAGHLEKCAVFLATNEGKSTALQSLQALKTHRELPSYIWSFCLVDMY